MVNCLIDENTLHEAIAGLYNAFVDCPQPSGKPCDELESAMASLEKFMATFNVMLDTVGADGESFLDTLNTLIDDYHQFWKKPFPEGLECGQKIISAIMEKVLRTLLKALEQIKNEDYSRLAQPVVIDIDVKPEAERFTEWITSISEVSENVPESNFVEREYTTNLQCDLGSLAASFLLGWWIGSD